MLSCQHDACTVFIWTVTGRMKNVAYTGSPDQLKTVATLPVGESGLVCRDGRWFLYASLEVPERPAAVVRKRGMSRTSTTMRLSTSPSVVSRGGAPSTAHTRPDLAASEEETCKPAHSWADS